MKPGILFSPGAFHPAACFDEARDQLSAAGFDPVLVTTHPSLGEGKGSKNLFDDVAAVRCLLQPHIDGGREFILIGHSCGGFPAWVATERWTVANRTAIGNKGGVVAVVLVAASVPLTSGAFALGIFSGSKRDVLYPPYLDPGPPGVGQLARPNELSKGAFYSDMSEDEQEKYASLLLPQSRDAFETPVTYAISDPEIPVYYILCGQDEAVPPESQEMVAAAINGCTVMTIDSGHCCFISQVEKCVKLIDIVTKQVSEGVGAM